MRTGSPTRAVVTLCPTCLTYPAPGRKDSLSGSWFKYALKSGNGRGMTANTFVTHHPRIMHAMATFQPSEMQVSLTNARGNDFDQ